MEITIGKKSYLLTTSSNDFNELNEWLSMYDL